MERTAWFNRVFPTLEDNGLLPGIIERLNGTPARMEEMLRHAPPSLLILKTGEKWSIQEEAGHLSDMEPLWLGRLEDIVNKLPTLRIADLTNQQTHQAHHNAATIDALLQRFRAQRQLLVNRLFQLKPAQLQASALHPRLQSPMRIIDLAYFVAEHDDHHLAGMRQGLHMQAFN